MEMLFSGDKISLPDPKFAEYDQQMADLRKENDQFVQLVAHDLKSPVRKLGTYVERLVMKSRIGPESDAHPYIIKIENTLADLDAMLDSMSAYADLNVSPQAIAAVDLNTVLQEMTRELEKMPQSGQVGIKISELPIIAANRNEIKMLFRELFSNSMKFKPEADKLEINISSGILSPEDVKTFNLAPGKVYHQVVFSDNGIGFSQEYNKKIFQPFYRLHGKSTYPGYGLGLAIAQKIMNKHEGLIFANANEKRGASFTIIFSETN